MSMAPSKLATISKVYRLLPPELTVPEAVELSAAPDSELDPPPDVGAAKTDDGPPDSADNPPPLPTPSPELGAVEIAEAAPPLGVVVSPLFSEPPLPELPSPDVLPPDPLPPEPVPAELLPPESPPDCPAFDVVHRVVMVEARVSVIVVAFSEPPFPPLPFVEVVHGTLPMLDSVSTTVVGPTELCSPTIPLLVADFVIVNFEQGLEE